MLDGECTTDALPSPPRNKKKYSGNDNKRETKSSESDEETKEKYTQPQPQPRPFQAGVEIKNYAFHIKNAGNIQIGNNYFNGRLGANQNPPVEETEQIRSLKNSSEPVTDEDIDIVSEHMCDGWEDTARALGYSRGQIDNFESRHLKNRKQVLYDLLTAWIQEKGRYKATVGVLAQTLWDKNQKEALKIWSQKYKYMNRK